MYVGNLTCLTQPNVHHIVFRFFFYHSILQSFGEQMVYHAAGMYRGVNYIEILRKVLVNPTWTGSSICRLGLQFNHGHDTVYLVVIVHSFRSSF